MATNNTIDVNGLSRDNICARGLFLLSSNCKVLMFIDKNSITVYEKNVQIKISITVDEYHVKMHPITRV